ncbi:hypothetical protein IFM89_007308 [Coptis chinensis]|uniref:Reticulon-like protein n=1 Tax=Coptis chinensis TaxID=261450 RepID=A0A835LD44_9MAGN|nr:hypothetical protein IFM89_007308 [Coptis chinensis]
MLIPCKKWLVKIADLGPSIQLEPYEEQSILAQALRSGAAKYVSADLRQKSQLIKAFEGADVVFHMAAPDSSINNQQLHYSVNVQGTKNVIDACVECKVKRLIYTSSPSVVFDGVHGIFNGDESLAYPSKHNDSYSATKAEGEALVIKSNGRNGLLTCCIRPSSIFGPGDRLLVPSLVTAARAGKSKFIIGDGNNLYDFTYVENVAHAHVCAEHALSSEGEVAQRAAGQAYFITNMEPIKFWEFVSRILEGLGYERPSIKIPVPVMMPIAHVVEWTYKVLAPYGMRVPQLTPSRIRLLSRSRTFSCSKARDRLGYEPIVSLQDGLKRTIESYSHLRAEQKQRRVGPSKASIYLGRGKIANTLLWKDKKQTLTAVVVLIAFYSYFIASGYTIITAVSQILLMATLFLFVHGILPAKVLGYTIEKIPASNFHFPEKTSHQVALSAGSTWNYAVNVLKSLCKGEDFVLFVKVVISLLICSFLGATSIRSIFMIGMPFAFVAFFLYEKKEEEIDGLVHQALLLGCKVKSDISKKFLSSK